MTNVKKFAPVYGLTTKRGGTLCALKNKENIPNPKYLRIFCRTCANSLLQESTSFFYFLAKECNGHT